MNKCPGNTPFNFPPRLSGQIVGRSRSGGMKVVVAILLVSSLSEGIIKVAPEVVANVTLLLARYYNVNCVQIFRTDIMSLSQVEGLHRLWRSLAMVESRLTTGVYTYKKYLEKKTFKPRKVSCYRSLKIMSDDRESQTEYLKFSMKFSIKDAIWVLYTNSLSEKFFQDARVVFDDVIIIAVTESPDVILFYEVYRISEDLPLKVLFLGKWTKEESLQLLSQTIYDRRSDLEGLVLRTASVENWPSSYAKNGKWHGFLIKLWEEIQALINCTSVDVKAENLVGMRLENGSWNGLVGMAMRNEIDVLVTEVVIDKERSQALNFFHPIMKSNFQIYMRHLGYQWQWASIFKPFHVSVWGAIVAWVVVATLLWTLICRVCASNRLESMDFENFTPLKSFFFVTQALCQQGYHYAPNSCVCRVLFFVSYAVSSVLIPSYSASLVSSLAQKIYIKSFDSLQDMVADGSYRLMVKENTAQHAFFVHSKDDFLKLAYEKLVKPVPEHVKRMGIRQSAKALCHLDKYAVMGIEDIIEGRLHHLITMDCPLVHLTNPVSTVYITMATAKNNPYWGVINYHLGKLLNMGVAERLKRAAFPMGYDSAFHTRDSEIEVGMQQVISVFIFVGTFTAASIFLLLLEIQYFHHKDIKNRLKRKKRGFRLDLDFRAHRELKMKICRNKWAHPKISPFRDFFFSE